MYRSPNIAANTAQPGNQNNRISEALDGRFPMPVFQFRSIPGQARQLLIKGWDTGCGDQLLQIPERTTDSGNARNYSVKYITEFDWKIDLDNSAISTANNEGGIIGGYGLSADTEYIIWAFLDSESSAIFRGFGLTKRPVASCTVTSGGGLGSSATLSLSSPDGNMFRVGQRVIIRQGNSIGDIYNQGEVTAQSSNSLTVDMDPSYGGAAQTNGSISGISGEVIQYEGLAPYMYASGDQEHYPGGGTEYEYCQLGSLRTDGSSNISYIRRFDEPIYIDVARVRDATVGSNSSETTCLARWVPVGTESVELSLIAFRTTGSPTGRVQVGFESGKTNIAATSDVDTSGQQRNNTWMPIQAYNTALHSIIVASGASVRGIVDLVFFRSPNSSL